MARTTRSCPSRTHGPCSPPPASRAGCTSCPEAGHNDLVQAMGAVLRQRRWRPGCRDGDCAPSPGSTPSRLDSPRSRGVLVLVALAVSLPPRPLRRRARVPAHGGVVGGARQPRPAAERRGRAAAPRRDDRASPSIRTTRSATTSRDGRPVLLLSLLVLPAAHDAGACRPQATGGDPLKAGPAHERGAARGRHRGRPRPGSGRHPLARRAAAALLPSSPVLGFLLWPHPEVLSFSMATFALVAGMRGRSGLAALCAAVASVQNPPLALLAVFEAARPFLTGAPARRSRRQRADPGAARPWPSSSLRRSSSWPSSGRRTWPPTKRRARHRSGSARRSA